MQFLVWSLNKVKPFIKWKQQRVDPQPNTFGCPVHEVADNKSNTEKQEVFFGGGYISKYITFHIIRPPMMKGLKTVRKQ